MMLNIGDTAPDFSLKTKNAEGLKDISLSDHKDKQAVVLLFFPFDLKSKKICHNLLHIIRGDFSPRLIYL